MKRLSTALALSAILAAGLTAAITSVAQSGMIRPIPVHFVNVATLPAELKLGVSEMLCLTRTDEVGPYVGLTVTPEENGPIVWSRRGNDERDGAVTIACFDTVNYGEVDIHVLSNKRVDGVRTTLDVTLHIKVE
jgi:hypothetical protein